MTIEHGIDSGFDLEAERRDPSTFVVDRFFSESTKYRATIMDWEMSSEDNRPQLVQTVFEYDDLITLLRDIKGRASGNLIPIFNTTRKPPTLATDDIVTYEWPPISKELDDPTESVKVIPFDKQEVEYWTHYYETGQFPTTTEKRITRLRASIKKKITDIHSRPSTQSSLHRHNGGGLGPLSVR